MPPYYIVMNTRSPGGSSWLGALGMRRMVAPEGAVVATDTASVDAD